MQHSWSWLPPSIILSILSFTFIFLLPHQKELQNEGSFKGHHNRPHLFIFTPTSMLMATYRQRKSLVSIQRFEYSVN